MRAPALILVAMVAFPATGLAAEEARLEPGGYEVEVRIHLANVRDVAAPLLVNRCISPDDLKSGQAFFVLSDNPLKRCNLVDFESGAGKAFYRIECPGPNRGRAVATFQTGSAAYRGTIEMNMGGKNMTMSETQAGRRVGECP